MPTSKPILIITHSATCPLGQLPAVLGELGLEYHVHCTKQDGAPPLLDGFAGAIIMGGIMGVYDAGRLPWLEDEMGWLSTFAMPSGKPILGICLGCQMLAAVTGGKVSEGSSGYSLGFYQQKLVHEDAVFGHELAGYPTLRFHGDTYTLGHSALRLAEGHPYIEQAAKFADKVYGVQFHPEANEAWLDCFIDYYVKYKKELPNHLTREGLHAQLQQHKEPVRVWFKAFLSRLFA